MRTPVRLGLWQGGLLAIALLASASTPVRAEDKDKEKDKEKPAEVSSPKEGERFIPTDVDMAHPVYETSFDDPAVLKDWRLEGGKSVSVANGNLVLESKPGKKEGEKSKDHLVCWLDREMPADFLLEFTVKPVHRDQGLAIVFFCGRGLNGENIFDPSLKPRTGEYPQYNRGDINCYHISYWKGGDGTPNLRKSKGFHLVAQGKNLVADAPSDSFQTVRVYKRGGKIRLMVDDVVALAWDDDGTSYGLVLQSGWMALRQMGHTERSDYGHVKVYPLKP